MLGDDAGAADIIGSSVEQHADGRRFGLAADHAGIGEGIDDGVADDVDAPAAERVERAAQLVEGEIGASISVISFSMRSDGGAASISWLDEKT